MSLLAVKAAIELSKYIVDKYHYGIDCNTCSYKYAYYARMDFVSDCYDVCVDDITVPTVDTTLDCSAGAPTFVEPAICTPATEILDCNQEYVIREMQAFEENSYLYTTVLAGYPLIFEFNSAIVNGTEYLSGTRKFNLDTGTITTESVGSLTYVTNIITFLNSLNLPDITFYPGTTNRTMKVRFPSSYTWQITSAANNDTAEWTHGVRINQNGLVSLDQFGLGYIAPPYGGSTALNFQLGYATLFTGNLC